MGVELVADNGKELVALEDGKETGRSKQVYIPTGETSNDWIEVDEIIKEPEPLAERTTEEKIEELEFKIGQLKQLLNRK